MCELLGNDQPSFNFNPRAARVCEKCQEIREKPGLALSLSRELPGLITWYELDRSYKRCERII
jgi:hypothetical protein